MTIAQINVSTPFLIGVPNSQVSREWIRLLSTIVSELNANITSDDVATIVFTTREPMSQAAPIDEMRSLQLLSSMRAAISNLMQRIESLEAQIPMRSASTAIAVMVSDDVATNATVYPVFANGVGSNRPLSGSSTKWAYNPSTGQMTASQLVATTGFGCNGMPAQTAFASGGAAPAGGTGTAAGGYDTAAHRDAAITLLNNIRTALVNNGIMT